MTLLAIGVGSTCMVSIPKCPSCIHVPPMQVGWPTLYIPATPPHSWSAETRHLSSTCYPWWSHAGTSGMARYGWILCRHSLAILGSQRYFLLYMALIFRPLIIMVVCLSMVSLHQSVWFLSAGWVTYPLEKACQVTTDCCGWTYLWALYTWPQMLPQPKLKLAAYNALTHELLQDITLSSIRDLQIRICFYVPPTCCSPSLDLTWLQPNKLNIMKQ